MIKMKDKKPNGVQLLIRAVVKDPDGKVLSDTGQKPSKSFVVQFLEFIGYMFNAPADQTEKSVSGAAKEFYRNGAFGEASVHFRVDAPANESHYGIVVGTGTTPEDNEDFKLAAQLAEGAGVGQITHGAMTIGTTAVVGANVDFETKRAFTNNTGSTITVGEAGIYEFYNGYGALGWENCFCIIRDVLSPTIEVPDKCSLTVYYTWRTTV